MTEERGERGKKRECRVTDGQTTQGLGRFSRKFWRTYVVVVRSGVRKRVRTWDREGAGLQHYKSLPSFSHHSRKRKNSKSKARSARFPSLHYLCSICRTIEIEKAILFYHHTRRARAASSERECPSCLGVVWELNHAMLHPICPAAPASKALAWVCRSFCGLPGVLGRLGVLREVAKPKPSLTLLP